MTDLSAHWSPLTVADLPAVCAIAAAVHPDFFEERAVFAERQALYPSGTLLLELGGAAAGYMLSHPWQSGSMPELNALLGAIPADADTYYLHDLALLPAARGSGAARMVVERLSAHAREAGYTSMTLVAVNGSQGFWERQGFGAVDVPALADTLRGYEDAARYMVKPLG